MSNLRKIDLAGKVRDIGTVKFIRAELPEDSSTLFATVYYSVNDHPATLGLRLDLSKKTFLDSTGIVDVDKRLGAFARVVSEAISKRTQMQVRPTPRSIDLQENFELDGYFWLPGEEESQSPGTLTYVASDKISLVLSRGFPPKDRFRSPFELGSFDIIHAQLTDGGVATLMNCFTTNRKIGSGGDGKTEILVNKCIIGVHAPDLATMRFTGLQIRFTSIEAWMGDQFFTFDRKFGDENEFEGITLTYTRPPALRFRVGEENLRISIHSGYNMNTTGDEINLRQTVTLQVDSDNDRPADDWLHLSWSLQMLFSLFYGEAAAVRQESLEVRVDSSPRTDAIACPFVAVQKVRNFTSKIHPTEMLLSKSDMDGRLELVLNGWFKIYNRGRHVLGTFFGTMFNADTPNDLRFVAAVSSLEMYHRIYSDPSPNEEISFDVRLIALANALPPDARDAICDDMASLSQHVVVTQRFFLHGTSSDSPLVLDGMQLFVATDKLRLLFIALLLLQLGTPANELRLVLNRKGWMRWAMHQGISKDSQIKEVF